MDIVGSYHYSTTGQLRTFARYDGITGYRDMDREQLIAVLVQAELNEAYAENDRRNAATAPVVATRSAETRGVCTFGIQKPRGLDECRAPAVATFDASYGGILVEEGRCAQHA